MGRDESNLRQTMRYVDEFAIRLGDSASDKETEKVLSDAFRARADRKITWEEYDRLKNLAHIIKHGFDITRITR